MGQYDLYRSRMRGNITNSEIANDDIEQDIKDDFYRQPNYYQVYLNSGSTLYDVLISSGNTREKTVGYKILTSYPYSTYVFDSGDYITWTYGGESTEWLLTTIDKPNLYSVSSRIKRCNNDLKWIDSNGETQSYKCVIEDKLNDDTLQEKKEIILTRGSIFVTVQSNSDTIQIRDSKRFIFDGNAYKVRSVLNFTDMNTLTFVMDVDMINDEYDDVINNIANTNNYNYSLTVNENDFEQIVGYTDTLSYVLTLDSEEITKDVEWASSDESVATINSSTGAIELLSLGSVTFTARMTNNTSVSDSVTVTVVGSLSSTEENRISPNITEIIQGATKSQTYTVYNYVDKVASGDTFTITASGASEDYYTLEIVDGNTFTVTSLGYTSTLLTIICTNDTDATTTSINIQLKGLW